MRINPFSKSRDGKWQERSSAGVSLDTLINGITDYAITVLDSQGYVIGWNNGAERITGYSLEEIRGLRNDVFYTEEDRRKGLPAENIKKVLEYGRHESTSWRIRKDGSHYIANIIFFTLIDGEKLLGISTITRDITEQKLTQDRIAYTGKLMEDISDAVISLTFDYKLKGWNKAAERLYGYQPAEVLGRNVEEVLKLRPTPEIRAEFHNKMDDHGYWRGEVQHRHKDGTPMTILVSASRTLSDLEEPDGYVLVCKDISERKKQEDQLKDFNESLEEEAKEYVRLIIQSEKKYKMLFESNPMPMWMLSLETYRTIDVNTAALQHYGYNREEFLALDSKKMWPPEDESLFLRDLEVQMHGIVRNRGLWRHRKKDGELIHAEISVYDFLSEGVPTRLVLANDITEQIEAEEKLKKSYEGIRELASHLQDVREEERALIAREIHDELGQQLTGLKMDFSWFSRKIGREDEAMRERIANTLTLLDDTIKTVRRIATELRPGILDDLGLVPAIEWQAEEFQKRSSIPTRFTTDAEQVVFTAGISIGLFRICQESLTNIARHAEARNIDIALMVEGENISLRISDDGKGFQQEKSGERKTLGLLGMKERAMMMGGKFEIRSAKAAGTTVRVTIPFNIIG